MFTRGPAVAGEELLEPRTAAVGLQFESRTVVDTAVETAQAGPVRSRNAAAGDRVDFGDALATGAAAAKIGGAVVLTDGETLPAATSAYLSKRFDAARFAIGGSAAKADPGATAVVGADRYETATRLATRFFTST